MIGGRFGQICRGWVGTSDNMRRARYGIIEGIGGGISFGLISEHSKWLKVPGAATSMIPYWHSSLCV